jgi:hypothetical protein
MGKSAGNNGRQAGRTLRTIVEGAAANALASGLLTIWP